MYAKNEPFTFKREKRGIYSRLGQPKKLGKTGCGNRPGDLHATAKKLARGVRRVGLIRRLTRINGLKQRLPLSRDPKWPRLGKPQHAILLHEFCEQSIRIRIRGGFPHFCFSHRSRQKQAIVQFVSR